MILLHTMSLSGSIAAAVYLVTHFLTKHYLSVTWHKIYLTVNIILFIMPFGYFKKEYTQLLNRYFGIRAWYQHDHVVKNVVDFTIFVFKDGFYIKNLWIYIVLSAGLFAGLIFLALTLRKYKHMYSGIMKEAVQFKDGESVLKEMVEKEGLYAKLCIKGGAYLHAGIKMPFTIGIIHKRIMLPDIEWEEKKLKYVLCHELTHIKVMDNLVKVILTCVVIVNFYNPFAYYLMYWWNLTAEMYCDNKAAEHISPDERKEYAKLIIDFAEKNRIGTLVAAGLSTSGKQLKERIINMKKTGKKYGKASRLIGAFIIAAAIFASSLTAYAYEERQIKHHDSENYHKVDDLTWYDDWEDALRNQPFAEYDAYEQYINADNAAFFVSETGAMHYIEAEGYQTYSVCSHNYVRGAAIKHEKNNNGGCRIDYYDGKRCSKCGTIIYETYIKTTLYGVCNH